LNKIINSDSEWVAGNDSGSHSTVALEFLGGGGAVLSYVVLLILLAKFSYFV